MQRQHFAEPSAISCKTPAMPSRAGGNISRRGALAWRMMPSKSPCATTARGLPADKLERIFEAYYTTKPRGTGLGLAVVKHNTELYGGRVRVESELGKGAKFTLIFPGENADATQLMSTPLPPLLVVDDEKNMRLSLQTMLGDEGYARAGGGVRRGRAGIARQGNRLHGHHRRAPRRHERL